jgi:hypothetical protein
MPLETVNLFHAQPDSLSTRTPRNAPEPLAMLHSFSKELSASVDLAQPTSRLKVTSASDLRALLSSSSLLLRTVSENLAMLSTLSRTELVFLRNAQSISLELETNALRTARTT